MDPELEKRMLNASPHVLRYEHDDLAKRHTLVKTFETVPVNSEAEVASKYETDVSIDVIHDGWIVPEPFRDGLELQSQKQPRRFKEDWDSFTSKDGFFEERDWGASAVALVLARKMGLRSFGRVRVARVLLDFGRLPGLSYPGVSHLSRRAINKPFLRLLEKDIRLLHRAMEYYDHISDGLENHYRGKRIKIAIHTYDVENPETLTERPPVSIITNPETYQLKTAMPRGVFDRLFPDVLGEFTANRRLVYTMAQTLQEKARKHGTHVALNFPYLLPDGSVELRAQVRRFFKEIESLYKEGRRTLDPQSKPYRLMWDALQNTSSWRGLTVAFRNYIDGFCDAPDGQKARFREAAVIYQDLADYMEENLENLLEKYRSKRDFSAFAIEVRKDLIFGWNNEEPSVVNAEAVDTITDAIAASLKAFLKS